MKNLFLIITIVLNTLAVQSQKNKLSLFENLIGKTWKAQGKWGDGSTFKQEITFQYTLDSNVVIAKSKGFVDKEQTKFGLRNLGIRKFDTTTGKIKFYEFDVFGGTTEGEVKFFNESIFYTYYYGGSKITDAWIKENDSTYAFIVGSYAKNKWKQKYLETKFYLYESEKDKILNLINTIDKAVVERDYEFLDANLSTDLKLIAPNGTVINKETALLPFRNTNRKSGLINILNEDINIRLFDDIAYATMKTTHIFSTGSSTIYGSHYTFKKNDGKWNLSLVSNNFIKN